MTWAIARRTAMHVDEFIIVRVADLPAFHASLKCALEDLYDAPVKARLREPGRSEMPPEESALLRHPIRDELTPADVVACDYQGFDWRTIASFACSIVDDAEDAIEWADIGRAAKSARLSKDNRSMLLTLFTEPILWRPGRPIVDNGQHRACALHVAGAEWVPVAPD